VSAALALPDEAIMAGRAEWMIYGANGYTGRLVAAEAKRQGLRPVLAGRRAGPIEALGRELALPTRVLDLGDARAAVAALADMALVAHCAGPFAATSAAMIDACMASRTHYLDITGELDVFLAAQRRHAQAQAAGIVLCPGVGFDVIPTDCLAAVLKAALPDATHLVLAFDAGSSMSRGTARTLVDSFRRGGRGGRVRRNGLIEQVPLAHRRRRVDFAGGSAMTVAVAWGDLATAAVSTGIPNIEIYARAPFAVAMAGRALDWVRPVLASAPAQSLLRRLADRVSGPSEAARRTGSAFLGRSAQCRGRTADRAAGDRQRLPPHRRQHDHGGKTPAGAGACGAGACGRLHHAQPADGRALRGKIAGIERNPRGLVPGPEKVLWSSLAQEQSMAADSKNSRSQSRLEKAAREDDKVRVHYEVEARSVAEKTARLRALRLAKEAADKIAADRMPITPKKAKAVKKRPSTGESLSEWLADQDKMGRRG
jgi:short subunit dehydrogenase-like uncharacterized protein